MWGFIHKLGSPKWFYAISTRLQPWFWAAALVLLTTTAHPWYLLWGFALVPMANNWVIWTLSLTLPWGYAVLGDMVHWTVPTWVLTAAYAPVFAALLAQTVIQLRQRGTRGGINAPARESPTTVQS